MNLFNLARLVYKSEKERKVITCMHVETKAQEQELSFKIKTQLTQEQTPYVHVYLNLMRREGRNEASFEALVQCRGIKSSARWKELDYNL